MSIAKELDARGLNCPMPVLRAQKMMSILTAGDVLKMVATDPGTLKDMESFCRHTGNELLAS